MINISKFIMPICFLFLISCNSNSPDTSNSSSIPSIPILERKLEIYLDRATLPTIQQMTQIIESKSTNVKFIAWQRYQIKNVPLLESLNAIFFTDRQKQIDAVISYLRENDKINNIVIHGSTFWSVDVVNLIKSIRNEDINVNIELELYDDGGAEYVRLYDFSMLDTAEQEEQIAQAELNISSSINGLEEFTSTIPNMFGFGRLYKTTYHMLRADIFETTLNLGALKKSLDNSIHQMKWDYFKGFTLKQKEQFYAFTEFNPELLKKQYAESNKKNFIFVGTNKGTATAQEQINIISEAKNTNSIIIENSIADYDLFFKGHPSADYNQEILTAHNMTEIYNKIPFETLIMTETLPDAFGGMGSSVFFSIPKTVENKFIFYKSGTDIEKTSLIQVMLKLGIIDIGNVKLISDLPAYPK